jgi:hypothetical protein
MMKEFHSGDSSPDHTPLPIAPSNTATIAEPIILIGLVFMFLLANGAALIGGGVCWDA